MTMISIEEIVAYYKYAKQTIPKLEERLIKLEKQIDELTSDKSKTE